jgi:small GTP-binding protein
MSEGPPADFQFKFIVLGDAAVGKSCIILRFTDNCFSPTHDSTVGVTFSSHRMHIGGSDIQFQVWDTAGQEIYRSITRSYYRDSDCAILVCDVTNSDSFLALKSWIHDVTALAPPRCKIVIAANKVDLVRQISHEELQKFADEVDTPLFETSALTGLNIAALFEEAAMLAFTAAMTAPEPRPDTAEEGTESQLLPRPVGRNGCC